MLVERPPLQWAYPEEIPGTRCDPEDGPWPRSYQVLDDDELWEELGTLARPHTSKPAALWKADSVNFQPSARTKTQDRRVVKELNIHGQIWTLTGVFDGHLGDTTVEHVAFHLPIIVEQFLSEACSDSMQEFDPSFISDLFRKSIIAFDDAIANDVLNLFPGGIDGINDLSDEHIRTVINDQHSGSSNYNKVRLCMYGTTALVALIDPQHDNLWVANVGDCQALLVTSDGSGEDWQIEHLTAAQNGDNDAEIERVLREHPGEDESVVDRRVLGALAPTRSLGDVPFKQPAAFSRRILYNLYPGFQDKSQWEEFLVRNRTPPYISATPEITHRFLRPSTPTEGQNSRIKSILPKLNDILNISPRRKSPHLQKRYLILGSDGFTDLCSASGQQHIVTNWARKISKRSFEADFGEKGGGEKRKGAKISSLQSNLALSLLKEALGGDDTVSVSRVLTLQMDEAAWIDDTALVVQTL